MLSPGLSNALLDSWDYFLHLAVLLVPLFIGASFLVGLAQEYLPPEKSNGNSADMTKAPATLQPLVSVQ